MNLLPLEARRALKKEYRKRFIALFLVMLASAVWLGASVGAPAIISSWNEYNLVKQEVGFAPKIERSEEDKAVLASMRLFDETIILLDSHIEDGEMLTIDIIDRILGEKPASVGLTTFSLVSVGTERRLVVSGVAQNRESLVLFSRRLEAMELFSAVDLPISNLSQRADIEFSITATIKEKEKEEAES